jgi:hypothetical protein
VWFGGRKWETLSSIVWPDAAFASNSQIAASETAAVLIMRSMKILPSARLADGDTQPHLDLVATRHGGRH